MGSGLFEPVRRLLVTHAGRVRLAPLENEVLFYLSMNLRRPVALNELAAHVWGHSSRSDASTYRQVLRTLRRKLAKAEAGWRILTIVGRGYALVNADEKTFTDVNKEALVPAPFS